MQVLDCFTLGPEPCPYLPAEQSTLEYEWVHTLSPEEYEERMNRGWRKFGPMLFHPVCRSCSECRPIRIEVERFVPDRSQRRSMKRNSDLLVRLAPPTVDDERLSLYNRYHAVQEGRKGWPTNDKDIEAYALNFVYNPLPSVEISVWEDGILRAVVLTEVTPNVLSGIYHYHDPDLSERGLGTFGMLQTVELARRLEKPWAYFGYYVAGCGSLNYKGRFHPSEVMGADGVWRPLL